ncbi:elongator complex protein-like protein 1 [Microthyrium microscopicum]|uniref:Elongator complex protein 1 n=1 Tax=Microthyrium microscopicum TaxID=703497 RepID=A0A6A6TVX6_9PEZI|nr:elongator complex protein-like protein 1 [Microthyrium microscopicum]
MRNLRSIRRKVLNFSDTTDQPLAATAWETNGKSIICVFGPSEESASIELARVHLGGDEGEKQGEKQQTIAAWDAPCPNPDLLHDEVLSLQIFPGSDSFCLILRGGDIVLIRERPSSGEEQIEIVGSVDDGISAARWSPDEELLALHTNGPSLVLMSRDFEPLADVKLTSEDVKASNHVSVGWGKVETQFKGKRAKALKDPTMPEKTDEGILSLLDDKKVTISWRGDGEFLAINSILNDQRRMIRVYSRDGALDSVSEPVDSLEGALSWRPSGNLLAGLKRNSDSAEVVFFERNGLRHGQFKLRVTEEELKTWASSIKLEWNYDSTVLAVLLKDRVQLWTMGNYHYYLKQTVWLASDETGVSRLCWNAEKPLLLAVNRDAQLHIHHYAFSIAQGTTAPPDDAGSVAVVDGNILKLTPFRYANVPPPMSNHDLLEKDEVIDVSLNSTAGILATLHRRYINVYTYFTKNRKSAQPKSVIEIPIPSHSGTPYQIAVNKKGVVVVLTYEPNDGEQLFLCNLEVDHSFEPVIPHDSFMAGATNLYLSVDQKDVHVQDGLGGIFTVVEDVIQPSNNLLYLPEACPWLEAITYAEVTTPFGLSESGVLYAGNKVLTQNCTSFLVTPLHLVFTTSNHLLKVIHLAADDELQVPADQPELDERCRSIERGAKLVTAIPSTYSLVLQMPRGNLETIYPRAMVLAAIRKNIDALDYKTSFMTCRNQRVDMNIIHDHNPEQFMENVAKFIQQIQKVEHIDLFLSQLRDEDVSQTMYRDTIKSSGSNLTANGVVSQELGSKINRVCDAFLQLFQNDQDAYLQNMITAHVCKSPPDLEGGLQIISKLKGQGEEVAERASEHICFLADVNQLYEHALGIYDLDVAILIAQQSQKDPREYLPYIQKLQEMSAVRRQFAIDNDLKRHNKAIGHLHSLSAFEEVKQYAEKHELYNAAIELYKYQDDQLRQLMRLYADFLNSRNRYKEAGIAYEFLGDYEAAISAYRPAVMWQEALSCAASLPSSKEDIESLAQELAEALEESKDLQAAATIYLDYLSDVESAARLLCKAYQFSEALRIIGFRQQPELVGKVVEPGLMECFTSTTELLADCKGQIGAQTTRLRELRLKKEQEPRKSFKHPF